MKSLANPKSSLQYRPDIDGLRAVAVLSVIAYHLGFPLHGGYVGVDIFFTISGFLIGSIILRRTAGKRFSFSEFYERRIRRIFPALIAMLCVSVILACKFLLTGELTAFAKSLVAVALSLSNVFFWRNSGYFDAPASEIPLLHTWSLAVEEQFYVFLPTVLVFLYRFAPKRVNLVICSLTAASFLVSAVGAYQFPTAAFYLPHTRAWELLIGTMIALDGFPKLQSPLIREVASAFGLILILVPLFVYRAVTPFPGLAALPPCLGVALVISAGGGGTTIVGRMLSIKPVVFVGMISYSLYLWHWLLIVFHKFGFTIIQGLDRHGSQALLLSLSLIMAWFSWRFVELPFRRGLVLRGRRTLFVGASVATFVMVTVTIALLAFDGLPSRFSPQAIKIAAYIDNDPLDKRDQYRNGICFLTSETATLSDFSVERCLSERPGQKTILVLGDSYAAAMWWGLDQVFPTFNVMQATASGCKPVLTQRPRQRPWCAALMDYALRQYLPTHQVDAVLIGAHWDNGDLSSLDETVSWLHDHSIAAVIVGPNVQYDSSLPRLLALSISEKDPSLPKQHLLSFVAPLDREMENLARDRWHIPYISLFNLFCRGKSCEEYASPGIPLLSDYGHLTKAGSVLAARRIAGLGIIPIDSKL